MAFQTLFFLTLGLILIPSFQATANITLPIDGALPNFIGVAVGSTTEWHGSRDRITGFVPGARLTLTEGRFFEWYGPYLGVNALSNTKWEAGPVLNFRFGRSDVEDPLVAELPEFGSGLEAGAYLGWHHLKTEGIPFRLRWGIMAITNVAGETSGTNVVPYASIWMPMSESFFVGIGAGLGWADENFMDQFFSVPSCPSCGLPAYDAGAGVRQAYAWPAALWRVSTDWMLGFGAFYQRLTNDAASSPIVTEAGDPNQWTYGAGIGYLW